MWQPISEESLQSMIATGVASMDPPTLVLWRQIRIQPIKWALSPWGDMGGGFWVVAVADNECIWYNDIEGGFNISRFETIGRIAEYWCNQSELHHTIHSFVRRAETGEPWVQLGPPGPLS